MLNMAAIVFGLILLTGCATTSRPEVILHEGPEGGVYLERITDRNVQPTHPVKLDRSLITRVLNGIQVGEPKTAARTLFTGDTKPERVFSDEDTAFLAPLISSALSQATPDQQVRVRVVHFASPIANPQGGGAAVGSSTPQISRPQKETTEGTLYVQGLSLHFTLDQYRYRIVKPDVIGGPNRYYPEATGLDERDVRFTPESAVRPDSYKQSEGHTVVIDYESLSKPALADAAATAPKASTPTNDRTATPSLSSAPAVSPSTGKTAEESEEARALKDLVIKKDMELETLKKELQSLRRQLGERDAQSEALKKKGKAPKSSETFP